MLLNTHWLRISPQYRIVRSGDVREVLHTFTSVEEIRAIRARMNPDRVDPDEAHRYEHVVVENYWLERPLGDGWIAAYRYTIQEGRPVVSELRVFPAPAGEERRFGGPGNWKGELLGVLANAPPGGLTARHVHNHLRMGQHGRMLRSELTRLRREAPQLFALGQDMARFTPETAIAALAPRSTRGRKGHGLEFFAKVAQEYVDVIQAGDRRPAGTIAERRGWTAARVRDVIHTARVRGLLTKARAQGQRGGLLTAKAQAILKPAAKRSRTKNVPANVPASTRKRPRPTPRQPTRRKKLAR